MMAGSCFVGCHFVAGPARNARWATLFGPRRGFREPLHVSEDSNLDILRPLIVREVRLFQEVDSGSSSEITLRARLTPLSAHEKSAAFSLRQSVGALAGNSFRARGLTGTILATVVFS
jgi:hypothetical protein